jgi:hypothetical protein
MGRVAKYRVFQAALCSATENYVSSAIPVEYSAGAGNMSIFMSASTSNADIDLTYEVSHDNTNFDTETTSPTRTIKEAATNALGVYKSYPFSLPVCKYVRFRLTGSGTNPASTTVTGSFLFDEED